MHNPSQHKGRIGWAVLLFTMWAIGSVGAVLVRAQGEHRKSPTKATSRGAVPVAPERHAVTARHSNAVAPATSAATAPPAATGAMPDYGGRDNITSTAAATESAGTATGNPMSQAWRAFEALVIVLAFTVGALYLIKKYGLVKDGTLAGLPLGGKFNADLARASGAATGSPIAPIPGSLITGIQNLLRGPAVGTSSPLGYRNPAPVSVGQDSTGLLQVISSTTLPGVAPASVHLIEVAGRRFLVGAGTGGMTLLAEWDNEQSDEAALESEEEGERFEAYLNRMGMTAQSGPEVIGERVSQSTDRLQAMLTRAREESEA